jgi:integrase
VAKALGRRPEEIEANPRLLGMRLKDLSAAALGISDGRLANIKSLFRQALGMVTPVMPGRSDAPLSAAWDALMGHLAGNRHRPDRIRVMRLVRWLSGEEIAPEAVATADLGRFEKRLLGEALLKNPAATWRDAVEAWNRCVEKVPGWPQLRIERQSRKETYTLPWSAFPESLKADVDAWLRRLACVDLDDEGPVRAVKPSTRRTREYQLRSFCSALVHKGVAAEQLRALADCLSLDHLKLGLNFYLERRHNTTSSTVHAMATMLTSVARHWLKADDKTLAVMRKVAAKLRVRNTGLTQKNRDRLRALHDPETVKRLLQLPQVLEREAERKRVSEQRRRILAQMAVAIEILLLAPVRIGNLAAIHLDRNLRRVGKVYQLVIDAADVKNSQTLEFELQEQTCRLIDHYLAHHRQAETGNRYLFPGAGQEPKTISTMRGQIERAVKDYVGIDVNPHLFRHIAAAFFLKANPGQYEMVRLLLGHKSMETTMRFYAGLESLGAARHFAKMIAGQRALLAEGVQQ